MNQQLRKQRKSERGFMALTSVLIIGAIVLVLAVSVFHSALTSYSISSAYEAGQQADFLADFCLRLAVFELQNNTAYGGPADPEADQVKINDMACRISSVEHVDANTKKISALGRAGEPAHFSRASQQMRYFIEASAADWQKGEELNNVEIKGNSLSLISPKEIVIGRTTETTSGWENWAAAENVKAENNYLTLENNETIGYRISLAFDFDEEVKKALDNELVWEAVVVRGSSLDWEASLMGTASMSIAAVINQDGENPPEFADEAWQEIEESATAIPGLEEGEDLSGKFLWTRQILEIADPEDPANELRLNSLTETISARVEYGKIEGYRISPVFDVSSRDIVKDSRIFWLAQERFDGTVSTEVAISHNNGSDWQDWQLAVNGASLPGLAPGTNLSEVKIKTKTSFAGGPDFYPNLENIKIFIEME